MQYSSTIRTRGRRLHLTICVSSLSSHEDVVGVLGAVGHVILVILPSLLPRGEVDSVAWRRWHWQEEGDGASPKDLANIPCPSEIPRVLVLTSAGAVGADVHHDGRTELLQSCAVADDEKRVIPEERREEDEKDDDYKRQEQLSGAIVARRRLHQEGVRHQQTVGIRVADEEHEELVVFEADAVVDPWAMMIHLEDASATRAAVVTAVGFDFVASVAVAHGTLREEHDVSIGGAQAWLFENLPVQIAVVSPVPSGRQRARDSSSTLPRWWRPPAWSPWPWKVAKSPVPLLAKSQLWRQMTKVAASVECGTTPGDCTKHWRDYTKKAHTHISMLRATDGSTSCTSPRTLCCTG